MRYEFSTPEPPRLRVGFGAGRIEIETADTDQTVVEVVSSSGDPEGLKVAQHGRDVVIESRKLLSFKNLEYDVRVVLPHGAEADMNVASARTEVRGRLGSLHFNTASGDVEIESVDGNAKVRSASGDVRIASVGGKVDVNTASGDLELGRVAGEVIARSASGDVAVAEVEGGARMTSASGNQTLASVAAGTVELRSASGDLQVGIKRGSRVAVDARSMSGETTSEIELGGDGAGENGPLVELNAVTMSGDVRIVRA